MNKARPLILLEYNRPVTKFSEPSVLCAHKTACYQPYERWSVLSTDNDRGQAKYQDIKVLQWHVHAHSLCLFPVCRADNWSWTTVWGSYSPVPVPWDSWESGERQGKGRCRVWCWYMLYGTIFQWKHICRQNISSRHTVMYVINAFAQVVVAESYTIARLIPPHRSRIP